MPQAKRHRSSNVVYFNPDIRRSVPPRRSRYTLGIAITLVSLVIAIGLRAMLETKFDLSLPDFNTAALHNTGALPAAASAISRSFELCGRGPRTNCVIDGDTFWLDGIKIRIADIDTPEIGHPQCDRELALGETAKYRLLDLLNAGPITLASSAEEIDQYGRKLWIVSRNSMSIGDTLVREGLAHIWDGRRHSWCR